MAKRAAQQTPEVRLDDPARARTEGWQQRFVNTAAWNPPEPLTTRELETLGEEAYDEYYSQRREWHIDLGPIKTPQLAALREDFPGLGKPELRCDPAHRR